jgi:hypothetical protein
VNVRTRLEKMERLLGAGGLPCLKCGWTGPISFRNEYIDSEGRTVRWEDDKGNSLPCPPDIVPCGLCKGRIKVVVVRRPAG